jgi:hypothetical protein
MAARRAVDQNATAMAHGPTTRSAAPLPVEQLANARRAAERYQDVRNALKDGVTSIIVL